MSRVQIILEQKLLELASLPVSHCIYRVPEILRNGNEEAYTPQVISIGPYHYKRNNLYSMNIYKTKYLEGFLKRTKKDLGTYVKKVEELERKVREYYNEDISLDSDEMVEMILTDGIFLVEFLIRIAEAPHRDDDIFRMPSLRHDIIHDLILLENQLPLFALKALYNVFSNDDDDWIIRLYIFSTQYFSPDPNVVQTILKEASLILILNQRHGVYTNETRHLLDFCYDLCVVKFPSAPLSEPNFELSLSATELQDARVRLEAAEVRSDMISTGIQFADIWLSKESKEGTLRIPPLLVNRHTESFFRNVIAYEHCHRKGHRFRSYVIFMDCLVNTTNDVDLLIKLGIIKNYLGETEHVCTLFNNLYKITMMHSDDFCYAFICKHLNKYSRDGWHQWEAAWFRAHVTLRRDYFASPWKIISVIAAMVLLGVTITQTVFTIKPTPSD